ncbi:hypothetical protein V6N13_007818 [Hibiscus sabdariffa]
MVTCTPSQQGTNRPRKGPNGASSQPVRRAPPPWHKGTMGAVKRVARRVQPRICREGWTVAQQQARVGCTGRARQHGQGASPVYLTPNPNQGPRNVESTLQGWPRPSATKGNKQCTGGATAGRALRRTDREPLTEITNGVALACRVKP